MTRYQVVKNVFNVAAKMPQHTPGVKPDGSTSNFGKHARKDSRWIDVHIETIEGQPMTESQLKEKIAEFLRSYPGYRSRGGTDYAPQQADRIFSAMRKEGLIVEVK